MIFIVADDLGFADIGCFNSPVIQTPHLDHLAREGMKLTSAYSPAPMCTPSRACFLTGRTNYRNGFDRVIVESSPDSLYLRSSENTLARLLGSNGYQTVISGKWHLNRGFDEGQTNPGGGPSDHGFDHWFTTPNNADPTQGNPDNFWRNGTALGRLEGFSSQLIADEMIDWLNQTRNPGQPFFAYLPFHAPHFVVASPESFKDIYDEILPADEPNRQGKMEYYANITHLDSEIGRVLGELDRLGLRENTCVVFLSDNGPVKDGGWRSVHDFSWGDAGIYRGQKRDLYEGGIRVPGIIRYPGVVRPGRIEHEPFHGADLFPTFLGLAETAFPGDRAYDGVDYRPFLRGESFERPSPLYFNFLGSATSYKLALRDGDWKLLSNFNRTSFALYNLAKDPGESVNLVGREPERFSAMRDLLGAYHANVIADPLRP